MIPIVLMRLITRIQSILEKLATYQYFVSFLYMTLFLYNCFFFSFFDMILFTRANSIISFLIYFCSAFFSLFSFCIHFSTENSYDTKVCVKSIGTLCKILKNLKQFAFDGWYFTNYGFLRLRRQFSSSFCCKTGKFSSSKMSEKF